MIWPMSSNELISPGIQSRMCSRDGVILLGRREIKVSRIVDIVPVELPHDLYVGLHEYVEDHQREV